MKKYYTLNELNFKGKMLTFKESLELKRETKNMNTYEFFAYFISKVTTLDDEQIYNLLLQDSYSIMLNYLLEQFENPLLTDSLTVKDFLSQEPNYEEQIIEIGGYRFSNLNITLQKAIECEKYCYLKKDTDLLSVYIMAGSCKKGIKEGIDTILGTPDTKEHRENIRALNALISQVSVAQIDCLVELENVSLVSNNSYLAINTDFFFF